MHQLILTPLLNYALNITAGLNKRGRHILTGLLSSQNISIELNNTSQKCFLKREGLQQSRAVVIKAMLIVDNHSKINLLLR